MVGGYQKLGIQTRVRRGRLGLYPELAPHGVDVLLLVVHACVLHHMVPDCRVGAIGANHEVEVNLDFASPLPLSRARAFSHFEPGLVFPQVSARELVVEEEGDVGHPLQNVQQTLVEPAAVDGEDGL
jgi:hypothetical protein